MRSLAKVGSKSGAAGVPLPAVFMPLDEKGIRPRRGQVTMIAGPPNGGKSFLALYWMVRLVQRDKLTALYFSADTDDFTMKKRAVAILTGDDLDEIERRFLRNKGSLYDQALGDLKNLECDFESDPTYDHMEQEILAFNEKFGDFPDCVIIDNLMNVVSTQENEWTGLKEVTKALHRVARQTGSAVFVLHHVNEGHADPRYPTARKFITGKVNQLPEMILSLGFDSHWGKLRIACVKNRSGVRDATGEDFVELYTDVGRGAIYDSKYNREEEKPA